MWQQPLRPHQHRPLHPIAPKHAHPAAEMAIAGGATAAAGQTGAATTAVKTAAEKAGMKAAHHAPKAVVKSAPRAAVMPAWTVMPATTDALTAQTTGHHAPTARPMPDVDAVIAHRATPKRWHPLPTTVAHKTWPLALHALNAASAQSATKHRAQKPPNRTQPMATPTTAKKAVKFAARTWGGAKTEVRVEVKAEAMAAVNAVAAANAALPMPSHLTATQVKSCHRPRR